MSSFAASNLDAPPFTLADVANALTAVGSLMNHMPAERVTASRHGVTVVAGNVFAFGRWCRVLGTEPSSSGAPVECVAFAVPFRIVGVDQ